MDTPQPADQPAPVQPDAAQASDASAQQPEATDTTHIASATAPADQPAAVQPEAQAAPTLPVAAAETAPTVPVAPVAAPAAETQATVPVTPVAAVAPVAAPQPAAAYAAQPAAPYAQQPAAPAADGSNVTAIAAAPTHTHSDRLWRPRTFVILGAAAAALMVGGASVGATLATGIPLALDALSAKSSVVDSGTSGSGSSGSSGTSNGSSGSGSTGNGFGYGNGNGFGYGNGSGSSGSGSGTGTGTSAATAATDAQSVGVVLINTELKYDNAAAAGTGIVLTSDGEILTNNHVVEGSTSISVTVASTGKTYTASVVGTDATDDVAVLKLDGASGLTTAKLDTSNSVAAGDAVTGVGNAGGTGTLSAAAGTVDALNQSVTTQAEGSAAAETLNGMIQISADIQSGDSGGPLLDAQGEVIGIDTAASSGTSDVTGFAIPITTATDIAKQILAGNASSSIVIGLPAFLGIEVGSASSGLGTQGGTSTTAGTSVAGVIDGTPAATAGLVAGDTITSVNGNAIASSSALTTALKAFKPGDSVTIGYVDANGATQSVKVTLIAGPAA